MRATWKGNVRFGLILIAAKLYTAIESGEEIKFNLVHKGDCKGEVGAPKQCKVCAKPLGKDDMARVFRPDADSMIVVEDSDIASVKLDTDALIDIIGFVKPEEIPVTFYDKPYFLGPDGNTASRPYILLREVMKKTKKVALGKVILRGREEFVVIRPENAGLVVQQLHYQREVRDLATVPGIPQSVAKLDANEMTLATTLVSQMETTFAEVDVTDRYHEALKAMLAAKQRGETIKAGETPAQAAPPVDIMAALQASLEAQQAKAKKTKLKAVPKKSAAA